MEAIADQDLKTAITAVSKLIQFENKGQLLNMNSAEKIFLKVQMHRIPNLGGTQELRVRNILPNRLFPEDASTCFIIKNTDEKKDDENCIEKTKELLKEQGITGDMFITLDQLKKEYKGHELKRKLAQQFDVFFSDSRIAQLALPHLGKEFMSRRRVPFVIRMERVHKIKQEVDLVLRTVQFIVSGKGDNVNVHFGHTQMSHEQLIENIKSLIEKLGELIPRGVKNIKCLHVQGTNTKAIPIYRCNKMDPSVNEPSGIELERQNMQKQLKEMMSDVQIKQKKRSKERSSLNDQEKMSKKEKNKQKKKPEEKAQEEKENEQPESAPVKKEKKKKAVEAEEPEPVKEEAKKKAKKGKKEAEKVEKKVAEKVESKPELGKRRASTRSQKAKRAKIE